MLPLFQCLKKVRGGKILDIYRPQEGEAGEIRLTVDAGNGAVEEVVVNTVWWQQHKPQIGGYYVKYSSGYESYSPANEFEEGYIKLPEVVPF